MNMTLLHTFQNIPNIQKPFRNELYSNGTYDPFAFIQQWNTKVMRPLFKVFGLELI